jgi:hypothetical protein
VGNPSITYFPVNNGDTVLVTLADGAQMVVDCCISRESRDPSTDDRCDVHGYLFKSARPDPSGIPHVDAFALSHADQDHCLGFADTFFVGDPAGYAVRHFRQGLIRIDELWFTPRLFARSEGELCQDTLAFKQEAARRMSLYRARSPLADLPGNRLRIMGYSGSLDLGGLEGIISVPGTEINSINHSARDDFSLFIHAPFRQDLDAVFGGRNETSLVLQARFAVGSDVRAGLVVLGGDAPCSVWETIVRRSNVEDLEWDILLAPHHCSWSFFSQQPYRDNKVPSPASLEFLEMGRLGARVVASCKPVHRDDDNPPHYAAAQLYRKAVGEKRFYVTSIYPEEKYPSPLVFRMTSNGPQLDEAVRSSAVTSSATTRQVVGTPQYYG